MARYFLSSLLLALLFPFSTSAFVQAQTPTTEGNGQAQVTLGQSGVPLYGPWKFQIGDSPIDSRTGKPLWAEPGFDDSNWEMMDLTPVPGLSDPWTGDARWVHGWRKKGHPDFAGWAWYRLSVRIARKPDQQIAIVGPLLFEDAWQLFANGRLLGAFGEFDRQGNV